MDDHFGKEVSEAVENAVNYATAAVRNVTARCEQAARAVERELHNLVRAVRESTNDDAEGGLKSAIVAKFKQVPPGGWFLLSLGMAGVLLASGREKRKAVEVGILQYIIASNFNLRRFILYSLLRNEHFVLKICFGSPQWEKTHEVATKTAVVLETLMKNGAKFIGKTVMDELGFSLIGNNRWLEIPKNPSAAYRICGGSSGGAAVAAASDVVDFALGIDTVGDIRVPAACCGVLGFRASHGAISMVGSRAMLECYSLSAGNCVLHTPRRMAVVPSDFTWRTRTADILSRSVQRTVGRPSLHDLDLLQYFEDVIPAIQTFKKELDRMSTESSQYTALDVFRESMLLFHRHEFKSNHGEWIAKVKPPLTTVEGRVQKAVLSPDSEALRLIAVKVREESRAVMDSLLKDEVVLVVPTLPSLPPKVDAPADVLELFEYRTHALMSLATISGCCQAVIPVGNYGSPMSVSLLARKGADLLLLDTVFLLHTIIQQEVLLTVDPNLPISRFLEIR